MPIRAIVGAGAAGALTIALLGLVSDSTAVPLLIAAFGSSCTLVFTFPNAPLAQPVNIVGGHVLAAAVGVATRLLLPTTWWSMALAVGLSIVLMAILRITHPPAGSSPIAIMLDGDGWGYLIVPVLLGSITVAVSGVVYRRIAGRLDRRAAARAAAAR